MALPSLDDLMSADISGWSGELIPEGDYNAVITNVEVRSGGKGPYLNIEATIHDEEYRGRKVWRNSSFSEKALYMPGGVAQLVQAVKPEVPKDISPEDIPSALAQAIQSQPVGVTVQHEDRWKDGGPVINPSTGETEQREVIGAFFEPSAEFVDSFEKESAGVDDELPF